MADNDTTNAHGFPSEKILDAVFLQSTHAHLKTVLTDARHNLSYFRREISSLTTEPELPADFRAVYGRIVDLLAAVEEAITTGKDECDALADEFHASGLWWWQESEPPPSSGVAEAAEDAIRQINEAETRLIGVVKSAKAALLGHAEQGLIDWSMPYDCEFSVHLNPGPHRHFYQTCGQGEEPMLLRLHPSRDLSDDPCFNDPVENWNVFEGMEGHPLRNGHHGYLVHCILDHSPMPWQLLPYIQEIVVTFTFRDTETVWVAPARFRHG